MSISIFEYCERGNTFELGDYLVNIDFIYQITQIEEHVYSLININTGNRWSAPIKKSDFQDDNRNVRFGLNEIKLLIDGGTAEDADLFFSSFRVPTRDEVAELFIDWLDRRPRCVNL
jgi:hypothetical protein